MGSSFFGGPNLRSGSTRKGKKSNSDKPKQPQRGLGVAQLEKIRLQKQLGISYYASTIPCPLPPAFNQGDVRVQKGYPSVPSSAISYPSTSPASVPFSFHPGFTMAMGEHERMNNHQSTYKPSWDPSKGIVDAQHYAQPSITGPFLNIHPEKQDLEQKRNTNHFSSLKDSNSQNFMSTEKPVIDLELRL